MVKPVETSIFPFSVNSSLRCAWPWSLAAPMGIAGGDAEPWEDTEVAQAQNWSVQSWKDRTAENHGMFWPRPRER